MPEDKSTDPEALASFAAGPEAVAKALEGLSDAQLDLRAGPDAWSIRQIVHHLADDGDVWSMCIKKAIASPGVQIPFVGFPGNEAWADALDSSRRGIGQALALMTVHRRYLVDLLEHFSGAWDRSMKIVDEGGQVRRELTIGEIVRMIGNHMHQHARTIEAIKAQHGIA